MLALRWLTQTTMMVAVLVAAPSMLSGAREPGGQVQNSSGLAAPAAGKPNNFTSPGALPVHWKDGELIGTLGSSRAGASLAIDRGHGAQPGAVLSGWQRLSQNGQATADSPVPRQKAASDQALLERARALLKSNDIAAARLIFTRLANNGVAEAAFELGRTYDPDFLKTVPIAGLAPDREVAWQWYKKAAALGNADAKNRLAKLRIDPHQ
jgi:TPR repeat protein